MGKKDKKRNKKMNTIKKIGRKEGKGGDKEKRKVQEK